MTREMRSAARKIERAWDCYHAGMVESPVRSVTIAVDAALSVSGLWQCPADPCAAYVFAHGAGAGMQHRFMTQIAAAFAGVGVATLRYQFPYLERGSRRPDPPALCHATVRAAVASAAALAPTLPLFAGGKSFGGRMSSQAQAAAPLEGVQGLIFFGFPLHPPGSPGLARAEHLAAVGIPMLFLWGTRDEFAVAELIEAVIARLAPRALLARYADADHSFHVPARSGRRDAEVHTELVRECALWMRTTLARGRESI